MDRQILVFAAIARLFFFSRGRSNCNDLGGDRSNHVETRHEVMYNYDFQNA